MGVTVVDDAELNFPIHASGHPCQDELRDMYGWVQPRTAIPVHGEVSHMHANAEVAQSAGVASAFTGLNGDLFMLAPQQGIQRGFARVGRMGLDGNKLVRLSG